MKLACEQHHQRSVRVSIIIKALNEEKRIEQCIRSALAEISGLEGEVILADSLSTDNTVEIASHYPINIVQLLNPEDRCCGIGPQLGYQHSSGEYIYILDGDMEFQPGFIALAMDYLEQHPRTAGVAGIITETAGGNYEFEVRKAQFDSWRKPGMYRWLDMGGLYRRNAIESVGYFSNRNLHAFEEQELGLRLSSEGWKLERIAIPSVIHHGHTATTFDLTLNRWKSGYQDGAGELLRNAIGQPWFGEVLKSRLSYIFMTVLFCFFLVSILLVPWSTVFLQASTGLLILVTVLMCLRKRSLKTGLTSICLWSVKVLAFIRGFCRAIVDPGLTVASKVVSVS